MMNDALKTTLAKQDILQSHLDSFSADLEALAQVQHGVEEINRSRLNVLRCSSQTAHTELQKILSLRSEFERQFRLPLLPEVPNLLRQLNKDRTETALAYYRNRTTEFSRAMKAMTTRWLHKQEPIRSLTGFIGLQEIGHLLNKKSIFSVESEERLRSYLGDWRSRIDWPSAIFTDPVERSDFYVSRGLDPTLTEFPVVAFDEAITIAGIKRPLPSRMDSYDYDAHKHESNDEAGFKRNNAAHDRLQRFESHVRAFIDQRMTAAFGKNWIKHQVSGEIRQRWKEKRDTANENGESEYPLIDYADFTDYKDIIVQNDNWNEVFAPIFQRKTLVQESFQRLYPIRRCTMHARIITQDDELYLFTETQLLLKAMGICI